MSHKNFHEVFLNRRGLWYYLELRRIKIRKYLKTKHTMIFFMIYDIKVRDRSLYKKKYGT